MLFALLVYAIKKYLNISNSSDLKAILKRNLFKIKYLLPLLLLSMANPDDGHSKAEFIAFNVMKNSSKIGSIELEKIAIHDTTTYTINSMINAKIVFSFMAVAEEKSVYKKDTLIYSSIYRKLNKKVKRNRSVWFENGKYVLRNEVGKVEMDIKVIHNNLVTLYFDEPKGISSVYCDNQSEMVPVAHLGKGKYRVDISSGKYNIFHYKNGRCVMVEAVSPMFNVTLIPVQP